MSNQFNMEESHPLSLRKVVVKDEFWKNKMELVRKEVIPYQWEALNDRISEAAPSFCMRNFKLAGKITEARKTLGAAYEEKIWPLDTFETLPENKEQLEEKFYGFLFQDSDFSKWIEAVAYSLTQHPDLELEKIADEAIDIVCAAQQENGYLDTYYIINDMSQIFTNLQWNHELYCFGHLAEGAVAYYQATGKDKLLNAAKKFADYIDQYFGADEEKQKGYPGHEIAEMALVRLYEVTGEKKYLDLSEFFLRERGTRPYYFDSENHNVTKKQDEKERYHYQQAHLPVIEQKEAVGHAVRAVYLYSGMADVARITKDKSMYEACETLWRDMTHKKMYITGGIGATHMGEAFSFAYDLPNDTAYAETCASIGLVFFARRMLEIKADRRYSDVMEKALYNGVLSGMALDGKSFFYVNPLEVLPEACHKDERKAHVKPVRQKWFGCACCPPNIARLVSSISTYAFTANETTMYLHLYMGGEVEHQFQENKVNFHITSEFPWEGNVEIVANMETDSEYTLALRIPEWCSFYTLNGVEGIHEGSKKWGDGSMKVESGYLYLTKKWSDGEKLQLDFIMDIRLMQSNSLVRENEGCLAVTRGPIVYCMEEKDNGTNLHQVYLDTNKEGVAEKWNELGEVMRKVVLKGVRYEESQPVKELYAPMKGRKSKEVDITLIPYYAWANRGEGEMRVWIRR